MMNTVDKAADLWGAECNEHCVAVITRREVLVEIGRCRGSIKAAESEKGYWLLGVNCNPPRHRNSRFFGVMLLSVVS